MVYPRMVEEWTAGRNHDHWQAVHDRINAAARPTVAEAIRETVGLRRTVEGCLWRENCGCGLARCFRFGSLKTAEDCKECPEFGVLRRKLF